MLTVDIIRKNCDSAKEALSKRGIAREKLHILDYIVEEDNKRKSLQTELDAALSDQKSMANKIGELYRQGDIDAAQTIKSEVTESKLLSKALETEHNKSVERLQSLLLQVPNIPHSSVPAGTTEADNEVIYLEERFMPDLAEDALPHWKLAKQYNLLDFELGTKITGPGFPLYRNQGAKLQRSLIAFFLDQATAKGYEEIIPPYMVNEQSALATGQIPDKEGQMYHMEKDNLYLIPTAEVPLTNIYRDDILDEEDLPIKITGYTPCFRREAGSYGADVKGLNRVHQFDKVEIVQITTPENSYSVLDQMVDYIKTLLEKLELPFRILRLCGGDLGFTSALTYDFEVYSGGQKRWLEVSSVSNFETFQSNRLKLRYKDKNGKKLLAHTLNGSALALARIVASILENYQTAEGIKVPEILVPYTNFKLIKK